MKNFLITLLSLGFTLSIFSQNVGIGTTSPTNTLHVIVSPSNPNPNPVRFEGIQRYTTEDSVLVVNPSTGVVKYMPMADVLSNIPPNILDSLILSSVLNNTDTIYNNQAVRDSIIAIALGNSDTLFSTQTFRDSVLGTILSNMDTIFTITRDSLLNDSTFINTLRDSIDTDIDSVTFANDTIYIYENGTIVQTYINTTIDTALVDSLILASSDTLYTIISDSLTKDTNWIKQIDSLLSIYGDTIYFNDSTYTLIKDSLLNDTAWLSELQDSINTDDQNIDSLTITGTILTTYIEDGTSASVDVSSMLDSVIFSKSDTLYSIFSDSLTKDTNWIKQIDSLLSIYGDTIYFNDSSYTLVRDSLLNDSLFLDSLVSLIGDSINTDDQNIDSLTITGTILTTYIEDGTSASVDVSSMLDSVIFSKSDTLYSIISDSLTKDSLWIKQIDSLLSIYGDTIYFNDSSYTLVRDSLLNDSLFLDSLVSLIGDSINTDDQNIDSLTITGTILTTYIEDGTSASVDVSSMLDSVIFSKSDTLYSIISDSLTKDSLWIKQIDSLLSIYGDTIYFNDSSYTLIRDSLLNDSLFLDSLVSLIGDSINTDDQNIDSLTLTGTILTTYIEDGASATIDLQPIIDSAIANSTGTDDQNLLTPTLTGTVLNTFIENGASTSINLNNMLDSVILSKSDTLYSIISDSLTKDSLWIKQIDSLLSIYGDTIYFNDTSYTLVRDSLLNDSLFLDSLVSLIGDSINTDNQNIDSLRLTGTVLTTYIENGLSATIDLQPIVDSAVVNASGGGDSDWDINANGTGLEGNPGINTASGTNSIAAGSNNTASGQISVALGRDNIASGAYSTALGGYNTSSGIYSSVLGGEGNVSSGSRSVVSGGYLDTASGDYSAILGGYLNFSSSHYSTIGGGNNNRVSGTNGVIGGGQGNIVGGDYGAILGGVNNTANGQMSSAHGGYNTAQSYGEWVGGIFSTTYVPIGVNVWNANDRLFVVGNGTSTAARSNALTLYKNGRLEINEAYTLPNVDGANTQVLTTDGAGNVSWQNAGGTDDQTLTLGAGTATTSIIDIESSASDITVQAGTGIALSEAGNTLTVTSTSVADFISVTNNTTVLTTDNTQVVFANSTTNPVQVTLPDATANSGRRIIIKWTNGGNAVTITSVSTIDGSSTLVGTGDDIEYMSDGTQWWVIRR